MTSLLNDKLKLYQIAVIFSLLFALIGFSYNVWRMEVTEENNNQRTASFEILVNLASLEQLIYTAHYDHDFKEGSPRKAWVLVGLINDLSVLTDEQVTLKANQLRTTWAENWHQLGKDQAKVDDIINAIDDVRTELKRLLASLK